MQSASLRPRSIGIEVHARSNGSSLHRSQEENARPIGKDLTECHGSVGNTALNKAGERSYARCRRGQLLARQLHGKPRAFEIELSNIVIQKRLAFSVEWSGTDT